MNLLSSDLFVGCALGRRHEDEQREGEHWQRSAHHTAAGQDELKWNEGGREVAEQKKQLGMCKTGNDVLF